MDPTHDAPHDRDEEPLDHRSMLALAEQTNADAAAALEPDARVVYVIWGTAWILGFAALWVTSGDDPWIDLHVAARWFQATSVVVAAIATIVHLGRRFVGVRGQSEVLGRRIGMTWGLAFASLLALVTGLDRAGADRELLGLVGSVGSVTLVGALYAAAGAAWGDATQFRLGAWLLVVAGVAGVLGAPHHLVVLAVGGGGGFLVAASVRRVDVDR